MSASLRIVLIAAALLTPSALALPPPEELPIPAAPTVPAPCEEGEMPSLDAPCVPAAPEPTVPETPEVPPACEEDQEPSVEAPCVPAAEVPTVPTLPPAPEAPGPCDEGQSPSLAAPCVPAVPDAPAVLPEGCEPPATGGCVPELPDPASLLPNAIALIADMTEAPLLRIDEPLTGDVVGSPVSILFTTNLPSIQGLAFEALYALPGEAEWQSIGATPCAGNATEVRQCEIVWTHDLDSAVSIRVGLAGAQTCNLNQCAHVAGIVLDTTAPTTTLAPGQTIPATQGLNAMTLRFATEPGATVTLGAERNGGPRALLGAAVANAAGLATFQVTPPGVGTVELFASAVDVAGNAETAPATPQATLHVLESLLLQTPEEAVLAKNGDTLTFDVCVLRDGEPVDGTGAEVVGLFRGDEVAFTYASGCTWTFEAPVEDVVGLEAEVIEVQASDGSGAALLEGTAEVDALLSEHRLVLLAVDEGTLDAFVPVGETALVDVVATYADTGLPAELVEIVAFGNGENVTASTTSDGIATFALAHQGVGVADVGFVATVDQLDPAFPALTSTPLQQTVVWTRVEAALDSVEHPARNSDVSDPFLATYRLTWAHDDSPATGATVELVDDADVFISGMADEDGLARVDTVYDAVGSHLFLVNSSYELPLRTFYEPTALTLRVNFTSVLLSLVVDDDFGNVDDAFGFEVTAIFTHDLEPVPGAVVRLLAQDNATRVLRSFTTNGTGAASGEHTFVSVFDGNVTARLVSTDLGVSLQALPVAEVERIVATRVNIADITIGDDVVHPGEAIVYGVNATYAHDGAPVDATLTFDPEGLAVDCAMLDGTASCPLTKEAAFSGDFAVAVETAEGITSVSGPTTTPRGTWTRILLTPAPPADALVDVGGVIAVPVVAFYEHNASQPVAGARVAAGALGACTTSAAGACTLALTSADVFSGTGALAVTQGPSGITQLTAARSTATLTWTKLVVDYATDVGPFNKGKAANFSVTVVYAHNGSSVPGALVSVAGFSSGTQSAYTNAAGTARVPGIETQVGTRALTISARQPSEGLEAFTNATGVSLAPSLRWTAIGFGGYTFFPAPSGTNATDGGPIFPTNTTVQVCTSTRAADDGQQLPGASITMRGITRTANDTGDACITIARSTQARNVTVTSHGMSALVSDRTITSSVDLRTVLHFVAP